MPLSYKKKVDLMSVAIHESWMRSRKNITKTFGNPKTILTEKDKKRGKKSVTMKEKWKGDMIPYYKLPESVKEWDRFEARAILAMMDILPPYMTSTQKKEYKKCVSDTTSRFKDAKPSASKAEAKSFCFRKLQLQCKPDEPYCEKDIGHTMKW